MWVWLDPSGFLVTAQLFPWVCSEAFIFEGLDDKTWHVLAMEREGPRRLLLAGKKGALASKLEVGAPLPSPFKLQLHKILVGEQVQSSSFFLPSIF